MRIAIAGVLTKKIESNPLGGTELFTHLLINGLVNRGHDVTLYCAKGSRTNAQTQVEICSPDQAMATESSVEFVYPYTLIQIRRILKDLYEKKFDILHLSFLKTFLASLFADDIKIPILHTVHRDFLLNKRIYKLYNDIGIHNNEYFVFVSRNALESSLLKKNVEFIYNGIDITNYKFSENKRTEGFVWLSRMDPLKGPKEAIQAALKAGVRLILSGDIDREKNQNYFDREIAPLISGRIKYIGPSTFDQKIKLFQGARAFIFPIAWEEPFGFVVVEAMACGTPIIAYSRGAMPEIIEDGKTGFLVDPQEGIEGLVKAINKTNSLSSKAYLLMRRNCRKRVEELFTADRMVKNYESLYKKLISI